MNKQIRFSLLAAVLFGLGLVTSAGLSRAQTESDVNAEASRMDTQAARQGESRATDRVSGQFNSFLGEDSKAVVTGLRNGTAVTLTRETKQPDGSTTTTTTTIDPPPKGKMGFGEVSISLALAKEQLRQAGITQPTPEQLKAALAGGTVTSSDGKTTQLQGVLTLRSQGMGWGQIANQSGVRLGHLMRDLKAANRSLAVRGASSRGIGRSSEGPGDSDDGIERSERREKREKLERKERPERHEGFERTERPERRERFERAERVERFERPERPEHRGRR